MNTKLQNTTICFLNLCFAITKISMIQLKIKIILSKQKKKYFILQFQFKQHKSLNITENINSRSSDKYQLTLNSHFFLESVFFLQHIDHLIIQYPRLVKTHKESMKCQTEHIFQTTSLMELQENCPKNTPLPKQPSNSHEMSQISTLRPSRGLLVVKYKTQMCKNYSQKGHCRYRNKCQFAHGQEQLHPNYQLINAKFKTKKCKSYWQDDFCKYGKRCQFDHQTILPFQTYFYLKIWKETLASIQQGEESPMLRLLGRNLQN